MMVCFWGIFCTTTSEATGREIVQKCMRVLAPGGVVAIIEFLAERGEPASLFSWLFSTMIHGTTPGGRCFSTAELKQLLTECGAARTEEGGGLPVGFVLGYRA